MFENIQKEIQKSYLINQKFIVIDNRLVKYQDASLEEKGQYWESYTIMTKNITKNNIVYVYNFTEHCLGGRDFCGVWTEKEFLNKLDTRYKKGDD